MTNTQAWNRYSYVNNNPILYNDPSGHFLDIFADVVFLAMDAYFIATEGWTPANSAALAADLICAIIPGATGGGLAVRATGGVVATGIRLSAAERKLIRAGQLLEKVGQIVMSTAGSSSGGSSGGSEGDNDLDVDMSDDTGKPLTADEMTHVDRINDAENFLNDHPDLAAEIEGVAEGGVYDWDHIKEARDTVNMLDKSTNTLTIARPFRNNAAQQLIDDIVEKGNTIKMQILDILE